MAIQVRRGLKKDFDPYKMLPGEWAVSIDNQTQNQIVWMCFAAGVVKRMGTYEDFKEQIEEITSDILNQFITQLTEAAQELQNNVEIYIQGRVDNEWIPALQEYVRQAEESAQAASDSASESAGSAEASAESAKAAKESEDNAKASEDNAKESEDNAALSEKNADDWSKLSESHNHGGTGVRLGEDTDNSKFWSEQSEHYRDEAKESSDNAQSSLDEINKKTIKTEFNVDDDGNLIYNDESLYNFIVGDDGYLYWEVA